MVPKNEMNKDYHLGDKNINWPCIIPSAGSTLQHWTSGYLPFQSNTNTETLYSSLIYKLAIRLNN